jgi:two-component system, response regulator PdtaR
MSQAKPTILVVEDDALLRMYAAGLLEENGFGAALKLLENRDDVRLLFTDIQMPAHATGWTWRDKFMLVGPASF